MMHKPIALAAIIAAATLGIQAQAQTAASQDQLVHLNQIQVIGTHNSYNRGFAPSEAKWLQEKNPKAFQALDYAHGPLASQLDGGVRQMEIDIAADPQGGRYSHPRITDLVREAKLPADPVFDPTHEMDKPGLKVIHIVDLNERSNCQLFVECLKQVHTWSQANPQHVPIFLLIENKAGGVASIPNSVTAPQFTAADFDELDAEIRSVFSPSELIVPDQVRGTYPTLEAAVLAGNWPTVEASRGKVLFLMDQKPSGPIYTAGHPSLKGRILFTNSSPGQPDAAFVEENEAPADEINSLVKRGYIVRARADENTIAARTNDTRRRDELLKSGAQFISTDYPAFEMSKWTGYSVALPDGTIARCNPVNAPIGCRDQLLEPALRPTSGGAKTRQ
ncbi:phosphatidylinositol-specific phospholipase C1-like protein [Edaphobacter aggregans]|uniref:phosphatidylinositol-specific phospholipase C1-like protein n=1 Tax=Edaphobacter aggregans TaxID=570835 RepID=UPI00316AC404